MSRSSSFRGPNSAQPLAAGPEVRPEQVSEAAGAAPPRTHDDQPTVITRRDSPATPSAISESAYRILQGKIMVGDTLGHYELVEYVGGGGMGRVFRAYDARLARQVAVKVLAPDQASDEETRLRFQNEAQSAARLDHENIARVFYVGEERGLQFIVFEFIDGINVRELVEQHGPLSLADAISYTIQVADALAHAAARDVVHRDIKPSNMLIAADGHVKLIDMGLARLRQVHPEGDLTASGVTLGTFDYISPEQARDPRSADVRSDIYSLGCTLFFMLTGRPPFPQGTVLQKLLQHQAEQPPDVRQFRPELPDEVSRVLRKMLAKDPRGRHHSPSLLIQDLEAVAQQAGLRPVGPGKRVWTGSPRRRPTAWLGHLPWLVPLVVLLFGVGSIAVFGRLVDDAAVEPAKVGEADLGSDPSSSGADASADGRAVLPLAPDRRSDDTAASNMETADRELSPNGARGATTTDTQEAGSARSNGTTHAASASPATTSKRLPNGVLNGFDEQFGADESSGTMPAPAEVREPDGLPADSESLGNPEGRDSGPGAPAALRTTNLVVDGVGELPRHFATLTDAITAATDGDVVELAFSGRREEPPLRLNSLRITLRAHEGCQPILVFGVDGDTTEPSSMITAANGRLSAIGIGFEMEPSVEVPRAARSLFELCGAQTATFERCWLTVRSSPAPDRDPSGGFVATSQNAGEDSNVAIIRCRPAENEGSVNGARAAPAVVELTDCVARGDADMLVAELGQPMRLSWSNGLLATGRRLAVLEPAQNEPLPTEAIQLDLRHLTIAAERGLILSEESPARPHALPISVTCLNSILLGKGALVEQLTYDDAESARQRFDWRGERNFFAGFHPLWIVRAPGGALEYTMDFATWAAQHESQASQEAIQWETPLPSERPIWQCVPREFALADEPENPALGAASDGRDVGMIAERLPVLEVPEHAGREPDLGEPAVDDAG
ncbi:MAG: serine/threonine-protein kinase [Planctomycetota bacterium]